MFCVVVVIESDSYWEAPLECRSINHLAYVNFSVRLEPHWSAENLSVCINAERHLGCG